MKEQIIRCPPNCSPNPTLREKKTDTNANPKVKRGFLCQNLVCMQFRFFASQDKGEHGVYNYAVEVVQCTQV